MSGAVVAVDDDGVLAVDPRDAGGVDAVQALGYRPHHFDGTGPDGVAASGTVWLNAEHGAWLAELAEHGAQLVWATSWSAVAADWIGPRLELPDMPVIEVPNHAPAFGWSAKKPALRSWVGDRPLAWLDDRFGGKEFGWAEDRRDREGIPTLIVDVEPGRGLAREHVEGVLGWLDTDVADYLRGEPATAGPHWACVDEALRGAGVPGHERPERVRRILRQVAEQTCPRCGAALGRFTARSRITPDRCVPVCGECGSHEGLTGLPAFAQLDTDEAITDWPLDPSEVRAQVTGAVRVLGERGDR